MSVAGSAPAPVEEPTAIPGYLLEELMERRPGAWTVFRATDSRGHRPVALTILDPALAGRLSYRRRLEREMPQVAELGHPNLIQVDHGGPAGGRLYVVTELEDAVPLDVAMRGGVLSAEDAVWLLGPIADALDHAHRRGLLHRGVAPRNIVVSEDRYALLANFGLTDPAVAAREPDPARLAFVAPELIDHAEPTPRSDVYGFAATALRVLIGTGPRTPGLSASDPLPDSGVVLTAELEQVLRRSLAVDPSRRAGSAGKLIAEIERVAVPDSAPPVRLRDGSAPGPRPSRPATPPDARPPATPDPSTRERELPRREAPVATRVRPATKAAPRDVGEGRSHVVPGRARRPTPAQTPVPATATRRRRRALFATLAVAALGATAGGVLAARDDDQSPAREAGRPIGAIASTPELSLRVPADWSLAKEVTSIDGLPLDESMQLGPSVAARDAALIVGVVRRADDRLLAPGFATRVLTPPTAEAVRIGSYAGYRYRGLVLRRTSQRLNLYTVPTTGGAVTVACLAQSDATGFFPGCEDVAGTLELKALTPEPLEPNGG